MKILRFLYGRKQLWGVLDKNEIRVLKGEPFEKIVYAKKIIPFNKVRLLAPAKPEKIVLVGLNYKDHARELGMKISKEPIIFLKPPTSLAACFDTILSPG